MLFFRLIFLLALLASSLVFAAAPSLVADYDLQLEKPHEGSFIPLADGSVLVVNVERVDGAVISGITKLDASGNILTQFPGYDFIGSSEVLALSLSGGRTLIRGTSSDEPRLKVWLSDGTLDPDFSAPFDQFPNIRGMAPADAGKVFAWGSFRIEGDFRTLIKLHPDGSLDETFPVFDSGGVETIVPDGDDHFLVVGSISFPGVASAGIHRITSAGVRDPDFQAAGLPTQILDAQRMANRDLIYTIFEEVGRTNPDGSPSALAPPQVPDGRGYRLVKSADGHLFVTGFFAENEVFQAGAVKLTEEGLLDPNFQLPANATLQALADGSLLVEGDFATFQNEPRYGVARLDLAANLLSGFDQRFADDGVVHSFDQFSDGSILMTGNFTRLISGGEIRRQHHVAKLTPAGLPDGDFVATFENGEATAAKVLGDDRILVIFGSQGQRWERFNADGTPGPAYPADLSDLEIGNRRGGLTVLENGTLSFLTGGWHSDEYQLRLLTKDDSILPTESFIFRRRFLNLRTHPTGNSYFLNLDGEKSIQAILPDGNLSQNFAIPLPGPNGSTASATAFAMLPGRGFLVAGSVAAEGSHLNHFYHDGSRNSSFTGRAIQTGPIEIIWTSLEQGQIFIGGRFTEYGEVSRPGLAQIRTDGSIESGFDLGSGMSSRPTSLIQLADGDLLIADARFPLEIDGERFGGIAKVRPVAQIVGVTPGSPSQVSGAATSPTTVELSWETPANAEGILIERKPASGGSWEISNDYRPDVTSHHERVSSGTSYNFRITAYSLAGESSTTITLTTPGSEGLAGSLSADRIDLLNSAQIDTIHRLANGKYLVGGLFNLADDLTIQGGDGSAVIRLNFDGSYDPDFQLFSSSNFSAVRTIKELPDGRILVGTSNASTSNLFRLQPDGTPDPDFSPARLTSDVNVIESLENGNLLIAGRFRNVDIPDDRSRRANYLIVADEDGQIVSAPSAALDRIDTVTRLTDGGFLLAGTTGTSNDLFRMNSDGSHDHSFLLKGKFEGANNEIRGIHQFPSGKILVGGNLTFWRWNEPPRVGSIFVPLNHLAVINSDGSLNLPLTRVFSDNTNGDVEGIGSLPSGKALVLGDFTMLGGATRSGLAIIDTEGSVDSAAHDVIGGGFMRAVETMSNGEVFPVGAYGEVSNVWRGGMVRFVEKVGQDAKPDDTFRPELFIGGSRNGEGKALAVSSEGDLYVSGSFELVRQNGKIAVSNSLARIRADGEVDFSYQPPRINSFGGVHAIALDSNGDLIIGGDFSIDEPDFGTRQTLAKVKPDGSLDIEFNAPPKPNFAVNAILVDEMDRIYVAGRFDSIGGTSRKAVGRFFNSGEHDLSFANSPGGGFASFNDLAFHDGRLLVANDVRFLEARNLDGGLDSQYLSPIEARGLAVRSFGQLGFAAMGRLADDPDSNLNSVAMFSTDPEFGTIWTANFTQPSEIFAYSKQKNSFYVGGNLIIGDRETSVASFDPASGLIDGFRAAKANGTVLGVARFGDQIAVAGDFTRWGGEPRRGLAFLEAGSPSIAPSQPDFTSVTSSAQNTLLRWDLSGPALAYRIEFRENDQEPWQLAGLRDDSHGAFLHNRGTNDGTREYRLIKVSPRGLESIPSEPIAPSRMSFELWKIENDLPVDLDAQSDRDRDGIPLLVEYALDLNPDTFSRIPSPSVEGNVAVFQVDTLRPDVHTSVEISSDLFEWTAVAGDSRDLAVVERLSVTDDPSSTSRTFFRVHCELRSFN